jgi:hypothetical protein
MRNYMYISLMVKKCSISAIGFPSNFAESSVLVSITLFAIAADLAPVSSPKNCMASTKVCHHSVYCPLSQCSLLEEH